jgi:pectate lyase
VALTRGTSPTVREGIYIDNAEHVYKFQIDNAEDVRKFQIDNAEGVCKFQPRATPWVKRPVE